MNTFLQKYIRPAVVITLIFTIVTGFLYPGVVTGLAQLFFHDTGQWQPDLRIQWAGDRLRADRAVLDLPEVLPWAALGDRLGNNWPARNPTTRRSQPPPTWGRPTRY